MIYKFFFIIISALLIALSTNAHTSSSISNCIINSSSNNDGTFICPTLCNGGVVVIEHGKIYGDDREIFVHCVYDEDLWVIIIKANKKSPKDFDKYIQKRRFKKTRLKRGVSYKWIAYDTNGNKVLESKPFEIP